MWEVAFFVLLGGATILYNALQGRKRLRAWQDAATSCGLKVISASDGGEQVTAFAGTVAVQIEPNEGKGESAQIVVAVPAPPGFHSVKIRGESIFKSGREIEIGDSYFDNTFHIEGPTPLVFSLLEAEARRLMLHVNTEGRLTISNGEIRAQELSERKVRIVLPLLLDLGQRFAQTIDVPRRLAENAKQDPGVEVRLQNLLVLIRELPGDPTTIEALRTACSDPSPEIRLRAAKELGAEGREALLDLARSMAKDAVSAEAVSILDRELPFERTNAILDQALTRRQIQTARACLNSLGRSGAAAAVEVLAKVMAQEESELAAAAAQALGETGSPAAEAALIVALLREQSNLQVAAAKSLGRVGSVAAVLPLKDTTERFWLDRELRRAARQAIAEIQSHVQGATPGQLSLAGAELGQLSLAQSEAGQLSLATDSAGQLSLRDAEEELK